MSDEELSILKWRVLSATTNVVADKFNEIAGSHGLIAEGFLDSVYSQESLLTTSKEDLERRIRDFAEISIWAPER